jgi:K+-transporting ATPase ATPase A chain
MQASDFAYVALLVAVVILVTPFFGRWLTAVLRGETPTFLRWLKPLETLTYKLSGIDQNEEMTWGHYTLCLILFTLLGGVVTLVLELFQAHLPLNPGNVPNVPLGVAVNTAASFITNTNWQAYSGEASMSYLTQALGLATHNFMSAATGIAAMAALARGLQRRLTHTIGNFWADLVRTTLYLLIPLSVVMAVVLIAQGCVMSFQPYAHATTLAGTEQVIPLGPAASQIAIKQLGTNGGGFYGQNSAHPFENPTPISNALELLAILLLPAACVYSYGDLVGSKKHARVLFAVMVGFFVVILGLSLWSEYASPSPVGHAIAMEGKETRFGITPSIAWANATTVTSNGSVNAMHDSLSPLSGGIAIFNIMLGEIIFGGIGSGMYGMVAMVILSVFLAGLMVGRTPEYLGKKIEAFEIRMAAVAILVPCAVVLFGSAVCFATNAGQSATGNGGPHALSEIVYAWDSMANNNGSAFGGLTATGDLYTWGGSIAMLVGRFSVIIPMLAIAGSMARKKVTPPSSGTFPTDGGLFAALLSGVIIIVVALTYFPVLTLGPVLEHFLLLAGKTF